jgi:phosphopantothenoylcysteine decarboxylase/phosphopantothenate--cysteine ligase
MLTDKRILLILTGGIAAYKALELIRRLTECGARVTPVLTRAAEQFVTPLSVAALTGEKVYRDLFDLTNEVEMGHIQLSRSADLILIAPATANIMAKMVQGQADDLSSTILLATNAPVMIAPAMNVQMWDHPATQRNLTQLYADGISVVGPNEGDMACGEFGFGRMSEPVEIISALAAHFGSGPLLGKKILVTSGALIAMGAEVIFITGPTSVPPPKGACITSVQTAQEMKDAVIAALPVDVAIFAAAVADWRVSTVSNKKLKKSIDGPPIIEFSENPDILACVAQMKKDRPSLVIGFAAETNTIVANATAKLQRKKCDWIVANDVSPETGIMGGLMNEITLISKTGAEAWPRMSKEDVAKQLAERVAKALC